MGEIFAVVGEDARQKAAGCYLRRMGYTVLGAEEVYEADYILLPLPLDEEKAGLAKLLRAAKPGALALGGRVSAEAWAVAGAARIELIDYFEREELARFNAIPTAEGCLALLMQNSTHAIWHSPFLVLGYGRVGRAVAVRLTALGGRVTVVARRPCQRAQALADGAVEAAVLEQLPALVPCFRAIVNTIPAPVLGAKTLAVLPGAALVVDLASRPGGTDFEAARRLGVRTIHALSLPTRCAPDTAGEFVGRTVLSILQERGELE